MTLNLRKLPHTPLNSCARKFVRQFAFCSAISLLTWSNDNLTAKNGKSEKPKMITFCPDIQDSKIVLKYDFRPEFWPVKLFKLMSLISSQCKYFKHLFEFIGNPQITRAIKLSSLFFRFRLFNGQIIVCLNANCPALVPLLRGLAQWCALFLKKSIYFY